MLDQNEMNDNESADALATSSGDYAGYVFVIPLSTPLPVELEASLTEQGSLLSRLAPLAEDPAPDEVAIVAVSGAELLALERAWTHLQSAKKVAVLSDLPGGKYDVLFSQARRQIGLRTVDWPSIEEAIRERAITRQRTKDKEPWSQKLLDEEEDNLPNFEPKKLKRESEVLPLPSSTEDDYED
jgi:hypothetical protein